MSMVHTCTYVRFGTGSSEVDKLPFHSHGIWKMFGLNVYNMHNNF